MGVDTSVRGFLGSVLGLLRDKIQEDQLQHGDHICTDRKGGMYYHHGIYVKDEEAGKGWVMHHINPKNVRKYMCGHGGDTSNICKSGVRKTCVECFLHKHSLYRYDYGQGPLALLKRTSSRTECDDVDKVVARATRDWLEKDVEKDGEQGNQGKHGKNCKMGKHGKKSKKCETDNGFGKYRILSNNCETFAYWCKTGVRRSKQVNRTLVLGAVVAFQRSLRGEPLMLLEECDSIE